MKGHDSQIDKKLMQILRNKVGRRTYQSSRKQTGAAGRAFRSRHNQRVRARKRRSLAINQPSLQQKFIDNRILGVKTPYSRRYNSTSGLNSKAKYAPAYTDKDEEHVYISNGDTLAARKSSYAKKLKKEYYDYNRSYKRKLRTVIRANFYSSDEEYLENI